MDKEVQDVVPLAKELQSQFLEWGKPRAEGIANPGSQRGLSIFLFSVLVNGCKLLFEKHGLVDRFVQLLQAFEHLGFLLGRLVTQQDETLLAVQEPDKFLLGFILLRLGELQLADIIQGCTQVRLDVEVVQDDQGVLRVLPRRGEKATGPMLIAT